jgi:hypothetical protein
MSGKNSFHGVCLPELQDLVLLCALDKLSDLMLLRLLDVELPPVPEIFCLLNLLDFHGALPQELLLDVVLLKSIEISSEVLESEDVEADAFELSADDVLLEAVEGDLAHVQVVLFLLIVEVGFDGVLAVLVVLGVHSKADQDVSFQFQFAAEGE